MDIIWVESPNFTPGRIGDRPTTIVLHHTECTEPVVDEIFKNPDPSQPRGRRSAHYCVNQDGTIHAYVHESDTAWHAGNWQTNLTSIGIEFEEVGDNFTDGQYALGGQLVHDIANRWGITISNKTIIPHKNVVATSCPGKLDINRIIAASKVGSVPQNIDQPVTAGIPAVTASANKGNWPRKINVKKNVYVRTGPSKDAEIVNPFTHQITTDPNQFLHPGDQFVAIGQVSGEDPYGDGRSIWYQSQYGHFVWAGNCN